MPSRSESEEPKSTLTYGAGTTAIKTDSPPWELFQPAQVRMESLIWLGTSGNGWGIGIPNPTIIGDHLRTRVVPIKVADEWCEADHGQMEQQMAQCSNRMGHYPAVGTSFIGFRLAKDAEKESQE